MYLVVPEGVGDGGRERAGGYKHCIWWVNTMHVYTQFTWLRQGAICNKVNCTGPLAKPGVRCKGKGRQAVADLEGELREGGIQGKERTGRYGRKLQGL